MVIPSINRPPPPSVKSPATVLATPGAAPATGQGVEAVVPVVRLEVAMVVPQQLLEAAEVVPKPCQVVALPLPLASLVCFGGLCCCWCCCCCCCCCWKFKHFGDLLPTKKKRQCHEVCVGCILIESCNPKKKNRVTILFLHCFGKRCDVEALTYLRYQKYQNVSKFKLGSSSQHRSHTFRTLTLKMS